MTRRREGQLGFGQVVLFGLLGPPETLLEPALRRIDGLLDDEALVDAVWRALRRRYPQSARRGRPATPGSCGVSQLPTATYKDDAVKGLMHSAGHELEEALETIVAWVCKLS